MIDFKIAKEHSLIKWKYAMKTGCDFYKLIEWIRKNHIEIYKYTQSCGFCQYFHTFKNKEENCNGCPLNTKLKNKCNQRNSPYQKWCCCKKKLIKKYYAWKLYRFIKKSKEKK